MDLTHAGQEDSQATAQLAGALVVARSAKGAADAGAWAGRVLLERLDARWRTEFAISARRDSM